MKITEKEVHYLDDDAVGIQVSYLQEYYYLIIDRIDLPKIIGKGIHIRLKGVVGKVPYAMIAMGKRGKREYLHLYLAETKPPKGYVLDHKYGDTLDNRKSKMRLCTIGQNTKGTSKPNKNTSSIYKGVCFVKRTKGENKWQAQIMNERKSINLGLYPTQELAAKAYNEGALKYHGEFARLNVIQA